MGVALDAERVEHNERGGGRAGGRAAGGWRDRGFNRTPEGGVLQREPVEYTMLCWTRRLSSSGCCVGHGGG